ncbi:unnamed protein product [Protopolystoma xenopodis]|uniref:Uncharacterized protein n=1 Tax=Protopolystoma xenopodis TaxID=117903 RepID=A0A3S5CGT4_9PLAT|nr:unnamed protein product [Protopolystoma xenopodis]
MERELAILIQPYRSLRPSINIDSLIHSTGHNATVPGFSAATSEAASLVGLSPASSPAAFREGEDVYPGREIAAPFKNLQICQSSSYSKSVTTAVSIVSSTPALASRSKSSHYANATALMRFSPGNSGHAAGKATNSAGTGPPESDSGPGWKGSSLG